MNKATADYLRYMYQAFYWVGNITDISTRYYKIKNHVRTYYAG
jgi:hypothetical protein